MEPAKIRIMPMRRLLPPTTKAPRKSPSPAKTETGEESSQQAKRRRAGKPKVKTGCFTCKIRRVKCDEIKPACNKCISTGRKCDGYPQPPQQNSQWHFNNELQLCKSLEVVQGTPAERRALDYFRRRTAPALSSYFDADFWSRMVLQIGHYEPVVRHAIVAVGALNEQRDFYAKVAPWKGFQVEDPSAPNSSVKPAENPHDPFVLQQYNKSISHLARRMGNPSAESQDIALLACILFVCVEFLRSNDNLAIQHFNSGMGIALAAAHSARKNPAPSDSSKHILRDQILPFFHRLELLMMQFNNTPAWDYPVLPSEAVPSSFTSLRQARESTVHLMNMTMRFIRSTRDRRYARTITHADLARQATLLNAFSSWDSVFSTFLTAHKSSLTPTDVQASSILHIHRLASSTWLRRCLSAEETATDADNPSYALTVSLAESLTPPSVPPNLPPNPLEGKVFAVPATFLFDMEVVSPLYLIATKCRHPVTRRRALACLRARVRREGLWDSDVAACVAERVMQIEERNLSRWDGSELPREEERVHITRIKHKEGPHRRVELEYFSFPGGRGRGVRCWGEVVVMREHHPDLATVHDPSSANSSTSPGDAEADAHYRQPVISDPLPVSSDSSKPSTGLYFGYDSPGPSPSSTRAHEVPPWPAPCGHRMPAGAVYDFPLHQ